MPVNANTFEGASSGTAVTTANSGGTSGRAFDTIVGTVTYDTAHAHGRTRSAKVDMAGATTSQVRWLDGASGVGTVSYLRFYIYLTAFPSQNMSIAYITDSASAFNMRVRIRATGTVDLIDGANAIMATTVATVATGQWVRIEAKVTRDAAAGSGELRLYNSPDSSTPTETLASTAAWNTGVANPGGWRFGGLTSTAATDVFWIDDLASDPGGWIGPAAVVGEWTGSASNVDAEISTVPTPGNWLIAVVASRVVDGSAPQMSVGDPSRNIWHLLYSQTTTAHATHTGAQMQIQVWACPAARYDGWDQLTAYAAAQAITASDVGTVLVHVAEVAGFANGYLAVDSVTIGTASAAGSLSIAVPAPAGGANTFVFAAAAIDDTTKTINVTGAGYSALTQVSRAGPDLEMAPAWQATTGATTASWSLAAGTANWAGVAVAIKEVGPTPAQPNANWPATRLEVGLGYDMSTPLSAVRWTDQTDRMVDRSGNTTLLAPRGIPYELNTAQSEAAALAIRNNDGAYTPRRAGSATASAAGTSSTLQCSDASAAGINVSDFFQLKTAAGALKELTVFQVTGKASSAGTATITFRRADGAGVALAATATGDLYVGVPVDLFIPYRVTMAWGGKWYPVASGSLGQLPQTWDNPAWGQVPAVGQDALSTLTAATPTVLAGEILRRRPYAYWPLNDPSGADQAQDVAGNGAPALEQRTSKWGAGADGTADFGASTQGVDNGTGVFDASLVGDPGSGWAQSGLTAAEISSKGHALLGAGPGFPAISGGITIMGIAYTATADLNAILGATVDPTMVILRNTDPGAGTQGSVIKLAISVDGATLLNAKVTTWDRSTHASTAVAAATNQLIGAEFSAWFLTFSQGSWAVYSGPDQVASGSCNLASAFSMISVGGEADQFNHGRAWGGTHAHITVWPRRLTAQEIRNLDYAARVGNIPVETTSRRVARKLNTVGWRGPRVVSASDVETAAEGADGGTIADYAAGVADDDDGLTFVDAAGQLQWRGHVTGYYQSVRATLGEDVAAGEIPYQPGQRYDYDATFIYNTVRIENSRLNGYYDLLSTTYVADDTASAGRYGPRTLSRSTRLLRSEDAYGLTTGLLARYGSPRMRVGTVEIDPATYPDAWPFCLGVEIGDLVTVKRRPMGAPVISQTCQILRISPDIGPGRARFTLVLGAADDPVVVLGDTVKGALGSTTIGW